MNQQKAQWWAVVFDEKENSLISELDYFQTQLLDYSGFAFVATIQHDQDTKTDGTPKRNHIHAVLQTESITKHTLLGILADEFHYDKAQISIVPTNSPLLSVQYLTHKNDPNKHQYDFGAIKTTNNELLSQLYNAIYEKPEDKEAKMLQALRDSETIYAFAEQFGIDNANKYRALFKDLKSETEDKRIADMKANLDRYYNICGDMLEVIETIATRLKHCLTPTQNKALQLDEEWRKLEELAELYRYG